MTGIFCEQKRKSSEPGTMEQGAGFGPPVILAGNLNPVQSSPIARPGESILNLLASVDDDENWRRMVTVWLKDAGYNVLAVSNASEALLQAGESSPGLIVLDLDLGGENGLMLMKYLKQNHSDVPILLFTGMEHDDPAVERMRQQ